jgi:hypothetical protein
MTSRQAMLRLGFSAPALCYRVKAKKCSHQEAIDYYASIRKERPHD